MIKNNNDRRRVLIASNDAVMLGRLLELLKPIYNVNAVRNHEAVIHCKTQNYQILLIDNGEQGENLALAPIREVRAVKPQQKIALLTDKEATLSEAREAGADCIIERYWGGNSYLLQQIEKAAETQEVTTA